MVGRGLSLTARRHTTSVDAMSRRHTTTSKSVAGVEYAPRRASRGGVRPPKSVEGWSTLTPFSCDHALRPRTRAHARSPSPPRSAAPRAPRSVAPRVCLEPVAELVERSRDTRIDGSRSSSVYVSASTLERVAQLIEVAFRDSRFLRKGGLGFLAHLAPTLDTPTKPPRVRCFRCSGG